MRVSLLVPVYGVEKYIERCVRSLFEQSYESIEYVFVDDDTPDNSVSIINAIMKDYPHRAEHTRIIHHKKNRGLAAARNTAVENCQTDFLIHVDSDDWLKNDAVEKLVNEQQKGNYDIVTGNYRIIYQDRTEKLRVFYPEDKKSLIYEYIKPSLNHVICSRLIRKALYDDNHISALEGYNIGEDHQVTPKLFYYAKSFSFVDDCLYNYDCTNQNSYMGQSVTPQKYGKKFLQDLKAFEILQSFFKDRNEQEYYGQVCKEMAKYCYEKSEYLAAFGLKDVFKTAWAYFDGIDDQYKTDLSGKTDPISMACKKNYYVYKMIRKIRSV